MHRILSTLIILTILTGSLQYFGYVPENMLGWIDQTQAGSSETVSLVAVYVDASLYADSDLKQDIDRYANTYIQSRLPQSKAVIMPIDTTTIHPREIVAMLDNIYHGGLRASPSTLRGVILIGSRMPIPVIQDGGRVYPSMRPYTDIDQP